MTDTRPKGVRTRRAAGTRAHQAASREQPPCSPPGRSVARRARVSVGDRLLLFSNFFSPQRERSCDDTRITIPPARPPSPPPLLSPAGWLQMVELLCAHVCDVGWALHERFSRGFLRWQHSVGGAECYRHSKPREKRSWRGPIRRLQQARDGRRRHAGGIASELRKHPKHGFKC